MSEDLSPHNCLLKTHTDKVYRPLPGQLAFHEDQHKYRGLITGVNAGKTVAGDMEVLLNALRYPGSRGLVGRENYSALRQSTWTTLRGIIYNTIPRQFILRDNDSNNDLSIIIANDPYPSEIIGWHLQKWQTMGGMELSYFYVDEVTELKDSRCFDYLGSRLRPGPPGPYRGWVTGTPNHFDWSYEYFVHRPTPEYTYIKASTRQNIYADPAYEAGLRARWSPEMVEMLLEGSFNVVEGKIFDNYHRDIHVVEPFQIPKEWPRYCGIDYGRRNPMACVYIAVDFKGHHYVYDLIYKEGLDIPQAAALILRKSAGQDIKFYTIDPHASSLLDAAAHSRQRQYEDAGIKPLRLGSRDRDSGLDFLHSMLSKDHPRLFILRTKDTRPLIEEIEAYRWQPQGAHGAMSNPTPMKDSRCHAIDAVRYCVMERLGKATEDVKPISAFWRDVLKVPSRRQESDPRTIIGNHKTSQWW